MSEPAARASAAFQLRHERAGRLDAVRVGLRWHTADEAPESFDQFATDGLRPGTRRIGDLEVELDVLDHGDAATFEVRCRNLDAQPQVLDAVVLGFSWADHGHGAALRFLRHGWQSWSYCGPRDLTPGGESDFPSGEWLRGMHHALGAPPPDRAGWHQSETVGVAGASGGGAACLLGALETGREFSVVYLRERAGALDIEIELLPEIALAAGESRRLEAVRAALDDDASRLLERFAELWGGTAGARTRAPFQAGWCSWYHFFHAVSEVDLLRNLEALTKARETIPISLVQLDDGFQRATGDWLETNAKFPRGLAPLASDIRSAGFRAGLWTAPFCVVRESRLFADHASWLLRDADADTPFRALVHPEWAPGEGWVYALDPSREEVQAHLRALFGALVEMGFDYLKLDFLYAVAMRARGHAPGMSRAARLRAGLAAIRSGAGDDSFLLGCGCPLGPAVGMVDGMRIGPDVAPRWDVDPAAAIAGLEPALPSLRSALRSTLARAWMHRRLWLNDPDCLMVRSTDTQLRDAEIRALGATISATGGMVVFSDDVPRLAEADRARLGSVLEHARAVDGAATRGTARALAPLREEPRALRAQVGSDVYAAAVAMGEEATACSLAELGLPESGTEVLLGPKAPSLGPKGRSKSEVALAPHEGVLLRGAGAAPLAVFCDFDGTFSVQDVGSTIAQLHLAERRAELWGRYERGECNAWEYNELLFEGFAFPESDLQAFLETIELDPGARALCSWCEERGVPFEILSDGFDYNLDRLQAIHDVRFAYSANHLRYERGGWHIEAGLPDPGCLCGTGICKRRRIRAWRAAHPGALCVHVGNGRVSDLCGGLEADRVFAKESLAEELAARGVAFDGFATLDDVVAQLERDFPRPGG